MTKEGQLKLTPHSVIGRYAPSPTGRLHLGNLRTALVSWLHARVNNGVFLLRIDDLDTPRNREGAVEQLIEDLIWLGLDWDQPPILQSERLSLYQVGFNRLLQQEQLFPCQCSRKDIANAASAPHHQDGTQCYPGFCRPDQPTHEFSSEQIRNAAWRFRIDTAAPIIVFEDQILGQQKENLSQQTGDFVVKRRDGLFAYQLANVIDDGALGVTDVVRGVDLIGSTPRQLALFDALALLKPRFFHLPLMQTNGTIMSKRNDAQSLDPWRIRDGGPEKLIGKLAFSIGLIDHEYPIDCAELKGQLNHTELLKRLID